MKVRFISLILFAVLLIPAVAGAAIFDPNRQWMTITTPHFHIRYAEENEAVVDAFLSNAPDFARADGGALPSSLTPLLDPVGTLRCLPHVHDTDGFVATRLERRA